MRELGVLSWGDIQLGPPPTEHHEKSVDEIRRERADIEERQRDIMFAASHVKPALRGVK